MIIKELSEILSEHFTDISELLYFNVSYGYLIIMLIVYAEKKRMEWIHFNDTFIYQLYLANN